MIVELDVKFYVGEKFVKVYSESGRIATWNPIFPTILMFSSVEVNLLFTHSSTIKMLEECKNLYFKEQAKNANC